MRVMAETYAGEVIELWWTTSPIDARDYADRYAFHSCYRRVWVE